MYINKLTASQLELFTEIKPILPANTKQIAEFREDLSAYQTCLRDRLFRLAQKGVLTYEEVRSKTGSDRVIQRVWKLQHVKTSPPRGWDVIEA